MRTELQCALNGEEFLNLDPRLYINDIEEQAKINTETMKRPYYGSMLVSQLGNDTLTITISFMIKEPNRIVRQQVIQKVNAWAKEGWLTINTRPYQRIYAYCTQKPSTETYAWHEEMKVIFTAYGEAYWQNTIPVSVSDSGTSLTMTINPLGTRKCCLEASIKNTSGAAIGTVSITANSKTIAFEGLSLANNKTLSIDYNEHHIMYAKVGTASKLQCRTAESADDIWLNPSVNNTVTVTCEGTCTVTLTARGAYE